MEFQYQLIYYQFFPLLFLKNQLVWYDVLTLRSLSIEITLGRTAST